MKSTSRREVVDPKILKKLYRHLERECELYREYIDLLNAQREALTNFKVDKVDQFNKKRASAVASMEELQRQRREILSVFPGGEDSRLTTLIDRHFSLREKARFEPLVDDLKKLVEAARKLSSEFSTVTQFAMNMVNGSLSIFHRARQCVSKSYSPGGQVKESYAPQRSRHETVLKEA